MTLYQAVLSGIIQGITEFFPISSSGHLVILHSLFGLKEPQVEFDVFLHLGTLVSVLIFFRRDIAEMITKKPRSILPIAVASIPTFMIGYFFKDSIENLFTSPRIVGGMLMITGIWLVAAAIRSRSVRKDKLRDEPGLLSSIAIGVAQGIAIIPGISRSGATIATGMLSGLKNQGAFRFAFLLSIPAVGGASLIKMHKIGSAFSGSASWQFACGGLVAMAVGLASIKALLKIVVGDKLHLFAIYCFFAGALALILL